MSGELWLTSDLHLGHVNIIRYTGRPFASVEDMDEWMIEAWNSRIASADTVWILGDVCMGTLADTLPLVSQLNGTLRLLCGNHDRPFRADGLPRHDWERRYREAGFTSIEHGMIDLDIGLPGPVHACHFPYYGDSHADDRFPQHRPDDDGTPLVHGHTHGAWRQHDLMIDVGVDAWGGVPAHAEVVAGLVVAGAAELSALPWRA